VSPANASEPLPAGVHAERSFPLRREAARIAWSPDGRLLAVPAADEYVIHVLDVEAGTWLHTLEAHTARVWTAAFDPAGRTLFTSSDDDTIRVWAVETGELLDTWTTTACNELRFGPHGSVLAGAHDDMARIWTPAGTVLHELTGHDSFVFTVAFDSTGAMLATGGEDGSVRLWHVATGELHALLREQGPRVNSVAFHPTEPVLASASYDDAIDVWSAQPAHLIRRLEGHTAAALAVAFTGDGRLLASFSLDQEVRIWDHASGRCVAEFAVGASLASAMRGIAFHPIRPILAVAGSVATDEDAEPAVNVLSLDPDVLLGGAVQIDSVSYATAKLVLVGESGVGKTGLGWRLAHGEFMQHASTHGQQFWLIDQLHATRRDGAECDAILWDLAGQPDYRLTHALFLGDADLALVLFDPTRDQDPLQGVEYWLRQLGVGTERDGACGQALLVAGRTDRGSPRLTAEEIREFCARRGIRGFVETSALNGTGVDELLAQMRAAIDWDGKPPTVTTQVFKAIKDFVLRLKEQRGADVIVTPEELREQLVENKVVDRFSDAQMLTAVGHLSNHGYVTRLFTSSGEIRILLVPELLNNVASSIVLEARRNQRGLGSLDEGALLAGEHNFAELADLPDADREILLDSAVTQFLKYNLCFRETDPLTARVYVVFPELINLRRPEIGDEKPVEDGVAYTISGAIENVYASLVVLLGYTGTFTRRDQWRGQARYVVGSDLVCGFRVEAEREGELDFVLYFGKDVGRPVRTLFQSLVESFLGRRNLSVRRYEPVTCPNGHQLNRAVVREQLADGNEHAFCPRCGGRASLPSAEAGIELSHQQEVKVHVERRAALERSQFEQAVFRLAAYVKQQGIDAPDCFISYAWGNPDHERWVERELATDLAKAGIEVILDRWDNARIGSSVSRFISRIAGADRILVVGTPAYRRKYENKVALGGYVGAAEGDLIGTRMMGSEVDKSSVLPLVVKGTDKTSLPALLQGRVFADFVDSDRYFERMLDVIISLYGIPSRESVVIELRQLMESRPPLELR
jgi:WD40 repeat protein